MLIPTALVANGYGKCPAGLGRSSAVIASCVSAPAGGASCWSSFPSQLQGCQDVAVSGKTQAGFSEEAKDLAGGWEADGFASCPQPAAKRPLSSSKVTNTQSVSEMFLSSLWCLAGLAHSEIRGLVGLGRQGFGMQLDCTWGLHAHCVMQRQKLWGGCPMSQLLSSGALVWFPSCTIRDGVGKARNLWSGGKRLIAAVPRGVCSESSGKVLARALPGGGPVVCS